MHCNRNTKQLKKKKGGGKHSLNNCYEIRRPKQQSKRVSSGHLQNAKKISSTVVVEYKLVRNISCYLLVISFILQSFHWKLNNPDFKKNPYFSL